MATTMGSIDLKTFKDLRDDVTQYFWFESNSSASYGAGVHITLSPESTFKTTPSGQNILMNTDGLSIRNGVLPMMVLDNDSLDFNTVDTVHGTYTNIATFGTTGARIGELGNAHSVIDADGQRFYASNGTTQLANIGYGQGASQSGTAIAPYYTFGIRASGTIGNYSVAEGVNNASNHYCSHAEGCQTTASGQMSHSEGLDTIASGTSSHAEGYATQAIAGPSHAEGAQTITRGYCSHAEGSGSIAIGEYTHVQNLGTVSNASCQTIIGKYNKATRSGSGTASDPYSYTGVSSLHAFIIGNGTGDDTNSRSDALTADWDGTLKIAGSLFTNMTDAFAKGSGTNHVIIGGYHVCWGIESVSTSTSYSEVEVVLPYTYSSVNTFLPFASIANRTAQARSAYATIKDESTLYIGAVATTSRTVNVVWMTIGT